MRSRRKVLLAGVWGQSPQQIDDLSFRFSFFNPGHKEHTEAIGLFGLKSVFPQASIQLAHLEHSFAWMFTDAHQRVYCDGE